MEDKQRLFLRANQEISVFLRRVEGLTEGTCWISASELRALSERLAHVGPELPSSSHPAATDSDLQEEIGKYIAHLRALQAALEKVHCMMLARKAQLDADRQHLYGVQGWLSAYHHTA